MIKQIFKEISEALIEKKMEKERTSYRGVSLPLYKNDRYTWHITDEMRQAEILAEEMLGYKEQKEYAKTDMKYRVITLEEKDSLMQSGGW